MEKRVINGKDYLIQGVDSSTKIDKVALGMLEHNNIDGFLQFKHIVEEYGEFYRYSFFEDESLSSWMSLTRCKKDVIELIKNILMTYDNLSGYLLDESGIVCEPDMIMVKNNKCLFAYLPIEKENGKGCLELIQELLARVKYAMDEDYAYIFDLQNAFSRGEIKCIPDMKKWVKIVTGEFSEDNANEDKDIRSEENVPSFSGNVQAPKQPEKPAQPVNHASKEKPAPAPQPEQRKASKMDGVNDIFAEFGIPSPVKSSPKKEEKEEKNDEKKPKVGGFGLFAKKEKQVAAVVEEPAPVQQKAEPKSKMVINDLNRGRETAFIGSGSATSTPKLIRDRNRCSYQIIGNDCVIGSEPGSGSGLMIDGNDAISRRHARIFVNAGVYYIEDLNSTNGSWLNGQILTQGAPCAIKDGDRITFADEVFAFSLS